MLSPLLLLPVLTILIPIPPLPAFGAASALAFAPGPLNTTTAINALNTTIDPFDTNISFFTNVTSKKAKPLSCTNVNSFLRDAPCTGWPGVLLLPDYWLGEASGIRDDHAYNNYDKIVCAPNGEFVMCSFVEGVDKPVPGSQIRALFAHLAKWCNRSRCGQSRVDEVDGSVRQGWFKVDSVKEMGNCRGLCGRWGGMPGPGPGPPKPREIGGGMDRVREMEG